MTTPTTPSASSPMQFDRAVDKDGAAKTPGVVCSMCNTKIVERYWTLGDQPACVSCKASLLRDAAAAKRPGTYLWSALFGVGAALVGALLYYAVLKILNLEIAIVAIAIGYMVGRAMKVGAKGWGGRRFQVTAAALTYLSIGLAYLPLALENTRESKRAAADSTAVALQGGAATTDSIAAAADSTAVVAPESAAAAAQDSTVATEDVGGVATVALGLFAIFAMSLALPVLVIIGSLPGGLISALIILFGIRQAWRMTAGVDLNFQGPLTIPK